MIVVQSVCHCYSFTQLFGEKLEKQGKYHQLRTTFPLFSHNFCPNLFLASLVLC